MSDARHGRPRSGTRHRRVPLDARTIRVLVMAGTRAVLPVRAPCSWACRWRFLALGSVADNATGAPTLDNYAALAHTPLVVNAFRNSIEISLVTAIAGGIFGFAAGRRGHPGRPADRSCAAP
ncbi:MAG: hypothetical protein WKF78_09955 [Candidatus Limnocylindrales bacterium]